jgi:alkylation response protein AidB-like acyl-CoA dehydrogenase
MAEQATMTEPTEASVRAEVRAWLEANWDPELDLVEWRNKLIDAGWAAPTWPRAWHGRDLTPALATVVDQEIRRIGAVGVARAGVRNLAAQTLLAHGTDAQKEAFLRPSLTGEYSWCQLFSEPGSGSDLAGAMTRAELKGNRWIVNGQKVWTTSAHHADWGLLLARTNWDAQKHQGLSYFLLNMRQPGVEVRPLRQMNGHASFNQVFFTDAEVLPEHLVGELGGGWAVATTTLMHERRGADGTGAAAGRDGGAERNGRIYDEERAEAAIANEPYRWYPQRAGRVDLVLERAKATGKINDPVVRQEIAKLLILARSAEWTARRARAAQVQGRPQGPEGSLGKLAASHVARAAARVHTLISGADAMLSGEDGPEHGIIAEILISVPAVSIAGGTDEIQRNIIAERVLRMPREPGSADDRPFRDVPKNVVG